MSNKNEVIGRAMSDKNFRDALFANPEGACEAAGLPLQAHEYAQIRAFDREAFDGAVAELASAAGGAG